MSMTLGRFSTSEDPDAGALRQSGDEVRFESMIVAADLNEFKARVQQLRGLVDNDDERVFPFTWSEDSTFDGFYTDLDVEVNDQPAMLASFSAPFSVRMRRVVGGFAVPEFETISTTVLRTNAHSVTTPTGILGATFAPTAYDYESSLVSPALYTTEDGAVAVEDTPGAAGVQLYSTYLRPADTYKAAARIEVKYGSTWYPIHGKHIPLGTGGNWRISNGYVRMYPSMVASTKRAFTVETWRSPSWVGQEFENVSFNSGTALWTLRNATGGTVGYTDPVVLRNDAEQCVVTTRDESGTTFTWSVRRGDLWVEATIALAGGGGTTSYGFGRSATEAATSFSGGIRATANDANGLRYLLACVDHQTRETTLGRLTVDSTIANPTFAIWADYPASFAGTDTSARDMFYCARSESKNVVSR